MRLFAERPDLFHQHDFAANDDLIIEAVKSSQQPDADKPVIPYSDGYDHPEETGLTWWIWIKVGIAILVLALWIGMAVLWIQANVVFTSCNSDHVCTALAAQSVASPDSIPATAKGIDLPSLLGLMPGLFAALAPIVAVLAFILIAVRLLLYIAKCIQRVAGIEDNG